uniref:Cytochrome P450 71A1-like n=1 Tax=Ananas comosus var. bracteatus TaxID=296719 RepID=A0A6V7NI07_ANACO|nr:unnamed protein product [Ananas comosus var. bracteatus]
MLLQLGEIPTLIISSADMAREIMRTHDLIFASRPLLKNAEILLYGRMDMAFSPYGEHWRQLKKLCTIHLLSTKRVQSYQLAREEEVAFMVKNITQCSLLHAPIDMSEVLFSFVNDNICRLVSGKFLREGGRNHFFRKAIEEIVILLGGFRVEDYFPSLAWLEGWFLGLSKRARRAFKIWDDVLDEVIKEHENRDKDDGEEDFVDVLLSLQKDPNMDFELKKEHIKAILVIHRAYSWLVGHLGTQEYCYLHDYARSISRHLQDQAADGPVDDNRSRLIGFYMN